MAKSAARASRSLIWVCLNKRTETAIDCYDREIGGFYGGNSLKKDIDIGAAFPPE
jgi:hypothetical protein